MKTMNPEERFERIEHQLEFLAVSIQSHDAQIAENSKHIAENSKHIAENSRQIALHSKQIEAQSGQVAAQSEQIAKLIDLTLRIGRIAEEQAKRMDDSQARTDERLNILIKMIESRFSDGH
jgi:septal ring factor EnvC (AmiA/AmiB activator)